MVNAAMIALPGQAEVPKLRLKRFEWMTDFSDAPCAEYAGEGVGAGVDYVATTIDAQDPCATIISFHTSLSGYFDDFVCLDRAHENPFGKNRMRNRMPYFLRRTKVIFNRLLKKLSCDDKIPL